MQNKAYHETLRYQAIAQERYKQLEEMREDMALLKLEHAIALMQAANTINRLQRELASR